MFWSILLIHSNTNSKPFPSLGPLALYSFLSPERSERQFSSWAGVSPMGDMIEPSEHMYWRCFLVRKTYENINFHFGVTPKGPSCSTIPQLHRYLHLSMPSHQGITSASPYSHRFQTKQCRSQITPKLFEKISNRTCWLLPLGRRYLTDLKTFPKCWPRSFLTAAGARILARPQIWGGRFDNEFWGLTHSYGDMIYISLSENSLSP